MSEKYYVVSESELNHLVDCVAYNADRFYGGPAKEWYDGFEAAAACRARPVLEINKDVWASKPIVDRMVTGEDPT
jgi:hypothetical protein